MVRFTVKKPAPTLRLNRVPGDVRPQEETFTLGEVSKALDQVLGEDLLDDLMAIEGFEDLLVQKGYVKKGVDEDLDKLEQEGSVEESIVKPGKGKAEVKKAEQGDDNPIEAPAATDEADEDGDEDDDEEISKALGDFADLLDGEGVEVTKGVMAAVRKYLRRWRGKGGKYEYEYADDKKGKGGKSPKKPTRPEVVRKDSEQRQRFQEAASFGIDEDHKEAFERAKSLHKEAMELAQSGKLDHFSGRYLETMLGLLTDSHDLSEAQRTEVKEMFDDIRGSNEVNKKQPAYGGDHWHGESKGGDSSGLSSDKVSEQKKHIYETADMVSGIKSYTEGYSDKGVDAVSYIDKEKLKKATDRVKADHLAIVNSLSSGKKLDGDVRERHKSHIDTLVDHGSISEATAKSMKAELKAQVKPEARPNRWQERI